MMVLPMLVIMALAAASTVRPASAEAQAFAGDWHHIILSEDEGSTLACRMLTVTTRRHMLRVGPDGRQIVGSYSRDDHPIWFGPTASCDDPPTPVNAWQGARTDWWAVRGTVEDDGRLSLVAEYDRCLGSCTGEPAVRAFSAELYLQRGFLIDIIEETNERLNFVAADLAKNSEAEASGRLFSLLQPLFQQSCTLFVEESLDSPYRATLPMTEFCMMNQRLANLLGDVIADQPVQEIYFDKATFFNHAQQRSWNVGGGGNVFVERLMILNGRGSGLPLAAIMRRQPSGDWKILSLMP